MGDRLYPTRIFVHHSATKDGRTFSWPAIRRYHMSWAYRGKIIAESTAQVLKADGKRVKRQWSDIGYHAGSEIVDGRLVAMIGRPWYIAGAHARGHNHDSLGYCFIGDYDKVEPGEDRLVHAARYVLAHWCRAYGIPVEAIVPHSSVSTKTCPGTKFDMDWLRDIVSTMLREAA